MGKSFENTKLVVRKAKPHELRELYNNSGFSVQYTVPDGTLRKEWPCFVLLQGKKIIGFRSFEFHEQKGKVYAWVGKTSLRKGFEGKGLGPFLVGRANAFLHALKFNELRTWAHEPRAKKFWAKQGFERVSGEEMDLRGNTQFKLDLKKQRANATKKLVLRRLK